MPTKTPFQNEAASVASQKWGGLPAAPRLKSRSTEPQALANLA
jgi:hypothetical protein